MSVNKAIAKDAAKTAIATFFMQAANFFVSVVIAALYGATKRTDAYFLALSIPVLYTAALFGALKAVFIPVFTNYKTKNPEEEKTLLGSMYFSILTVSFLVFLVLLIFTPVLVPILARGLDDEGRQLAVSLTLELLPLIVLTSLVGVLGSVYAAYQHFVIPILSPLVKTLVSITFIILTQKRFGVHSLAWGTVLGEFSQVIVLLVVLRAKNIYVGLKFLVHPAFRRMARLSVPPILGNLVLEFNPLVDKIMIASTALGSVTALNYATKLNDIPILLLSSGGFMTVVLSHWSKLKAEEGISKVQESLDRTLPMLVYFLAPILTVFYVLRSPLVFILYQRKAFTPQDAKMTATLWGILIFAVIPLILGRVLVRIFFILQDTVTPFWIGITRTTLNVLFNFIFKSLFGLVGIALSTSVTAIIMTVAITLLVKRRLKELSVSKLLLKGSKMVVCAILSGVVINVSFIKANELFSFIDISFVRLIVAVGVSSLLGFLVYFLLSLLFKIEEGRIIVKSRLFLKFE